MGGGIGLDLNDGYTTTVEDGDPRPGGLLKPRPDPTWAERAACRGKPVEWWYPSSPDDISLPASICRSCPVQSDCLQHAVRVGEDHGVWGGRSEPQRARMRRGAA